MNKIQTFPSKEFGNIRTMIIEDKEYFCGNDVATALCYQVPKDAISRHCKGATFQRPLGEQQKMKYIPLGDVYRLIVKASSQSNNEEIKEKAERFERLVFDEILPKIHKTGSYGTPKTIQEQVQTIAQATTELYEQVDKVAASIDNVKSEIETIKNDLSLLPIGADKIKNAVNKRVVSLLGGKQSGAYKDESLRAKVFINCHRNLKSHFEGIRSYKEIRQKDTGKAVKIINEYTPSLSLAEQIKMANAQQSFNFEEDEINSRYYNIGLIIGALRAELEKGTVPLESAYGLLTDDVKAAIDSELIHKGGTVK